MVPQPATRCRLLSQNTARLLRGPAGNQGTFQAVNVFVRLPACIKEIVEDEP